MRFRKGNKAEKVVAAHNGYQDGLAEVYMNPYSKYYETALFNEYERNFDRGEDERLSGDDWG